jgi:acyl carrier protein
MNQTQTVEERIREFVLKQFPLARKNGLKSGEKWLESGLIDSLGILDLVHFLEEEFKIQVSDEELLPDNFQSLDGVASFVRMKRASNASSAM